VWLLPRASPERQAILFVAISAGNREGGGAYSDIDMKFEDSGYFHKDGTPYPTRRLP